MKKLAPSILSADFSKLAEDVAKIEAGGADYIHVDVMDGHFVPNISFGAAVMKSLEGKTNLPYDVHLMIENPDQYNLVGKQKTAIDINENPTGPYPFNEDYFKTRYGGMQYYNAGCLTMLFIMSEDANSFPKLTQYGEKMALAFESVIKDTTYYKQYRLKNVPVPRDVLIEYGKVINLGLQGFTECKTLLRQQLFEKTPKLSTRLKSNAEYADHIYRISGKYSYFTLTKSTWVVLYQSICD